MMDKTLDESIGWGSHVWNDAIMFLEKPFHPSHRLKDDSDGDNDDMTMILIDFSSSTVIHPNYMTRM